MLKRLFNLGEYDANDFQFESSEIGITLQASYIEKIMGERKTIVAIENAQNIDEYSFEKIGDILNSTRRLRHVVLLEYTIGDNHGIEEAIRMKDRRRLRQGCMHSKSWGKIIYVMLFIGLAMGRCARSTKAKNSSNTT